MKRGALPRTRELGARTGLERVERGGVSSTLDRLAARCGISELSVDGSSVNNGITIDGTTALLLAGKKAYSQPFPILTPNQFPVPSNVASYT